MSASAPQVVSYQVAPGAVAAPQYTYMTGAPSVTYVTQAAPAPMPVTYAAQPVAYGTQPYSAQPVYPTEPAIQQAEAPVYAYAEGATAPQPVVSYTYEQPVTYAAPAGYSAVQPAAYSYGTTYELPQAASMVAYPGMPAVQSYYFPTSVQAAWDNHVSARGEQNLERLMLDYDDTSVVRVYDITSGEKSEFHGNAQIRAMFAGLFGELTDRSALRAPVADVEEEPKQVLYIWECPPCGYKAATETLIFAPDFKIKRQNIVVAKGPVTAAPASSPSATPAAGGSKKTSSKKTSSKKPKKGGCC